MSVLPKILRYRNPLLLFILVLLTSLVYWPGLSGDFIFDDYPNIVTNSRIHAQSLDLESLERAATAYEPGAYGRPLATVGFAIDYYLGGKDPWGYKLHGLIVHAANAALVFLLLLKLFALPGALPERTERSRSVAAFAVALAWAVHPLQVSSVLYVVQRMETLSLTFVLLALIGYLEGRQAQIRGRKGWQWLGLSAALACVGMLSKETAILFPAYALALELTLLRFDAAEQRTRRALKALYAIAAAMAILVFVMLVLPKYLAPDTFAGRDFNLYERLLTQLRVLPMYLGQMLLPLPGSLGFYYDAYAKSTGWLAPPATLFGGIFLLALFTSAVLLRKRAPMSSLGILWFFAAHLLTSNVFNLELAFEHRNYFALLGVLLVIADLVSRVRMRDGPALKVIAISAAIATVGFLGLLRASSWGNPLHLATELAENNRLSPRAANDLATIYVGMSDSNPNSPFFSLGAAEFERASRLPNASPLPEQGLILMAATTGQPVKDEWWDRLILKVKTRPMGPQESMAVTGLMNQRYAGIEMDDHRLSEAYASLLSRGPMPAQMYAQYGDFALTYLHDESLADRMFVEVANRSPAGADYPKQVAATLLADGRIRQAALVLERAHMLQQPRGASPTTQKN